MLKYKMLATRLRSTTASLTEPDNRNNKIIDEDRMLCSAHHICQARAQCTHVNEMIRLGKKDHEEISHFIHSMFVLMFDFV